MEHKRSSGKLSRLTAIAAVLFGLLGAAPYFIPMTGMRFSGALLMLLGAFLLLLLALRRLSRTRRWARWLGRGLLACFALGLLLFAALEAWVLSMDETDWDSEASALIVLGAGVNGRTPSLSLQKRLEAALEYAADKPDIPIVVTGGQGAGEEISEARCMADWLTAHGVAAERILLEEQASDTEENIAFSLALLKAHGVDVTDNIAVVSSDYHLCRAALLWGAPNMVPVAAHMPARFWPLTVNYYVREAFGVGYTLLKGWTGGLR
ncbi:MAG: YdcF family protein [Oscillospiraceae bacterium]